MSGTIWKLSILISFLAFSSISFARSRGAENITPGSEIKVLVYNYAHVSEYSLERGKRIAAGIFRQAGVEIVWRDCRPVLTMSLREASPEPPVGDEDLILRIVPRFDHALGIAHKEMLGSAFGNLATVSLQAVQDETASADATSEEVLGAAIAHELGHLLLGPDSHSERGIMRPHWRREDFARGPRGGLAFTPAQAQWIRTEVSKRVQEQATAEGVSMTASK